MGKYEITKGAWDSQNNLHIGKLISINLDTFEVEGDLDKIPEAGKLFVNEVQQYGKTLLNRIETLKSDNAELYSRLREVNYLTRVNSISSQDSLREIRRLTEGVYEN